MLVIFGNQAFSVAMPPANWRSLGRTLPTCSKCSETVRLEFRVDGVARIGCACTARLLEPVRLARDDQWRIRR
jgi:hypothetical protein